MEEPARVSFRDGRLASRKAEEAACRRFQAALWLEKMSGPLGLPSEPTEQQFVSCLRNGLVLCNAINKIQPGAVPKVVQNQSNGLTWENQTPPAYQYFENIRNFLVAVNEFKIPSFEASDIERDNLEAGSVGKIVDCILGLKAYHEWKQFSGGNGPWKYMKSPMVSRANSIISSNMSGKGSSVKCLDMSATSERQPTIKIVDQTSEDFLVQAIADCLFNSKENIDQRIFDSWHNGTMGSVELFNKVISSCKQDQQCCNFCSNSVSCKHWKLLKRQENELEEIKALLSRTKQEFASFQSQLQKDLVQLGFQIQELSPAAVGYHRAIKENRNLHNMLQELKGNIRVFCRVRPAFVSEEKCLIDYIGGDGTLIILDPFKTQNARKVFQFNKVFGPHVTQEEVYRETQPLIRSVMDGYNVCIFAYGQTGSGKTYTMCGPNTGSAKDVGINSKALNDLFQISCTRDDMNYDIHVQMVEIYNEQVRDLLIEETSTTKLEIRNYLSNGGLSLPDATMHHVRSTSDVMALMILGEKNRAFSCTAMNSRSSRSHSILTIHVCGRDASGDVLRSCLHLVDLAGSERLDKSEVTGERLKEALHINKSLSCLGDVFAALAQKSSYIPYRNSKLTLLLQNSLGGQAKMLMLAHVSPEAESCAETISTLKFAQRVSTVELGAAQMNKESNEIRELKEQLDNLKKELDNKEREKTLYLHKIKDNAAITERSKQNYPSPTQPRPRGLIENGGGYLKYPNANLGKSPFHRPKFSADQPVAQHNNQQETRSLNVKHTQLEEEHLKEVVLEYGKADASNKSFGQVNDGGRIISTCSPCIFGSPSVDHLSSLGSTNGKLDELATPESGNNTKPRSLSNVKSTKGTNFRKSLQTIGKFINRSEKRNYHQSLMQATKHERDADTTRKTPATAESRMSRRQSLTTLQASEIKASRRSSLGGKSVESLTTLQASEIKASRRSSLGGKSVESCVQVGKTPASQASAKATKPWL